MKLVILLHKSGIPPKNLFTKCILTFDLWYLQRFRVNSFYSLFCFFTASSKCVVWDLRKNESIIKISDSSRALRYKPVAWHPEVATQLCLASEDDHSPVIQIWDLRMASAPLKTLGIYSEVPKGTSVY